MITRWLDALAPHRRIVGEMLRYKFQPAHVHLQAALVVRLSRTVQWVREAARLDAAGRRRQIEEMGLTALFMATVMVWLTDTSEGHQRTRAILERRLASADRLMARLWPPEPWARLRGTVSSVPARYRQRRFTAAPCRHRRRDMSQAGAPARSTGLRRRRRSSSRASARHSGRNQPTPIHERCSPPP